MKGLLTLILLYAIAAYMIKGTPMEEKIKVHLIAIQRHAVEVAAERAAAIMKQQPQQQSSALYAATDLHQNTDTGVRSIPKGTPIHILTMTGDQITVTDGSTILVTSPDTITNIAPAGTSPVVGSDTPALVPGSSPPLAPTPVSTAPVDPRNLSIQTRIDEIDAEIRSHQSIIRNYGGVRATRSTMEIQRLEIQRSNLERQLH